MSKQSINNNSKANQDNNRREFLKNSVTAAAGFGFLGLGMQAQALSIFPPLDGPGTHNMMVVGDQTVYLSHLPMFEALSKDRKSFTSPHRYQVILEASFSDGTGDLTNTYTADRRSNPTEKMYTIKPALFVLPDLDPKGKALRTFRGHTVYRGHLERTSTPIFGFKDDPNDPPEGGTFDVKVRRVVHFHKFVPGAAKPAQLQYILFGKGPETFMAHFIAGPPDFDQIISVKLTGQQFTDEQLAGGVMVNFPGRLNTAKTRMKEKQKASGVFQMAGSTKSKPLQVEAIKEFYFEEGELRTNATFNPTVEERNSGFLE
jgi:hypothetical protein